MEWSAGAGEGLGSAQPYFSKDLRMHGGCTSTLITPRPEIPHNETRLLSLLYCNSSSTHRKARNTRKKNIVLQNTPKRPPPPSPSHPPFLFLFNAFLVPRSSLAKVAFIPVKGVPTLTSKLFDPRVEVLKEIFGDEPDAFPTGEFAKEEWLHVLVDIGLKNKLDKETFLQCAKKVLLSLLFVAVIVVLICFDFIFIVNAAAGVVVAVFVFAFVVVMVCIVVVAAAL